MKVQSKSMKRIPGSPLSLFLLVVCHLLVEGHCDFLRGGNPFTKSIMKSSTTSKHHDNTFDYTQQAVSHQRHYQLDTTQDGGIIHRALSNDWLVTIDCSNIIQSQQYKATLELKYVYLIETSGSSTSKASKRPDLTRIQRAIQNAVVSSLNACDSIDRPMYQVDASFADTLASSGTCKPVKSATNECFLVDGSTTINLVGGATAATHLAYNAIKKTLNEQTFLSKPSSSLPSSSSVIILDESIKRTEFIAQTSEALRLITNNSNSSTATTTSASAKVAIAMASLFFVLVSIFSYGLLKRQSSKYGNTVSSRVSMPKHKRSLSLAGQIGLSGANYFERMHDGNDEHGDDDDNDENNPNNSRRFKFQLGGETRSITWSVSDITSESGSFRSISSSRGGTTGTASNRLEKIEEEHFLVEEDDHQLPVNKVEEDLQPKDATIMDKVMSPFTKKSNSGTCISKTTTTTAATTEDNLYNPYSIPRGIADATNMSESTTRFSVPGHGNIEESKTNHHLDEVQVWCLAPEFPTLSCAHCQNIGWDIQEDESSNSVILLSFDSFPPKASMDDECDCDENHNNGDVNESPPIDNISKYSPTEPTLQQDNCTQKVTDNTCIATSNECKTSTSPSTVLPPRRVVSMMHCWLMKLFLKLHFSPQKIQN